MTANLTTTGYGEALTVVAYSHAPGTGQTAGAAKAKDAPTATLTTTTANSWVFAVGNDWTASVLRTVGPNPDPTGTVDRHPRRHLLGPIAQCADTRRRHHRHHQRHGAHLTITGTSHSSKSTDPAPVVPALTDATGAFPVSYCTRPSSGQNVGMGGRPRAHSGSQGWLDGPAAVGLSGLFPLVFADVCRCPEPATRAPPHGQNQSGHDRAFDVAQGSDS